MPRASCEVDIVVWGATGFTGRLVAEYLHERYGHDQSIRWALAGRSQERLEAVRADLRLPPETRLWVADAGDRQSLRSLAGRTKVLLTTVGPYQLYGSELVATCAAAGTDYVDLCGEPVWMRDMIEAHSAAARNSGARIVFSCGFDSVPFDLGVYSLQQAARDRFGHPLPRVKGRVRALKGTFSGGTIASFKATLAAASKNDGVRSALMNPFALTPGFQGPAQPPGAEAAYDESIQSWVAPFIMAAINTKNVHRSNFLLGSPYGENFVYDEMLIAGPGEEGKARAIAMTQDQSIAKSPRQPGEGPSQAERDAGFYELLFVGEGVGGEAVRVVVRGQGDPGYASTSKMIAETALCIAGRPDLGSGGFWTPAAIAGPELIQRLQANAGISFAVGQP